MGKEKILIVEDDPDIAEMIAYNLEKEGYRVTCALDGETAIASATNFAFDLIILDLMLPKINGLEVCKELRAQDSTSSVPIIMVTAKSQEADKVIGLELGADDYISKPFSPRELVARVRALLRRCKSKDKIKKIEVGQLLVDLTSHKVFVCGQEINLTPTEFKILEIMAKKPGAVLSRDKLLNSVFGYDSSSYDRTIDTHMKSLRKKLGQLRTYIETVRGVGYRFKDI